METTFLDIWSRVTRASILDTNFGVRLFTTCRMPGPNSWKTFIPASPPIVEPKLLNAPEEDRAQYGRLAAALATEDSTPRKYDVFSLPFPELSRLIKMREAA